MNFYLENTQELTTDTQKTTSAGVFYMYKRGWISAKMKKRRTTKETRSRQYNLMFST
jgi:hypothetical protein